MGLRYALGNMWLTLIVAETIAAGSGMGYMAMNAREFMQTYVIRILHNWITPHGGLGKRTTPVMAIGLYHRALSTPVRPMVPPSRQWGYGT